MPANTTIRVSTAVSLFVLVVAAVFIEFGAAKGWYSSPFAPAPKTEAPNATTNTPAVVATAAATGGIDENLGHVEPTYQESKLLTEYHFSFDNNCHGSAGLPMQGSLNVKQGSLIVLENHSTTTRSLAIGNTVYKVAAADFAVATAPHVTKNTGFYITCDGKGAGRLYVYP
jgi:hypothetical protein